MALEEFKSNPEKTSFTNAEVIRFYRTRISKEVGETLPPAQMRRLRNGIERRLAMGREKEDLQEVHKFAEKFLSNINKSALDPVQANKEFALKKDIAGIRSKEVARHRNIALVSTPHKIDSKTIENMPKIVKILENLKTKTGLEMQDQIQKLLHDLNLRNVGAKIATFNTMMPPPANSERKVWEQAYKELLSLSRKLPSAAAPETDTIEPKSQNFFTRLLSKKPEPRLSAAVPESKATTDTRPRGPSSP